MPRILPESQPSDESAPSLPSSPVKAILFASLALVSGLGLTRLIAPVESARFTGSLQAESTIVTAERGARIEELLAETGTDMQPGGLIVRLQDTELEQQAARKRADVDRFKAELAQANARAAVEFSWRRKQLDSEIFETELKVAGYLKEQFSLEVTSVAWDGFLANLNDRVATDLTDSVVLQSVAHATPAFPDEERIRALLRKQSAENAAEVYATQIEMCETRLNGLKKLKDELAAQIRTANGIDVAESRLAQADGELKNLEARLAELTLESSTYGTVGLYQKQVGDVVEPGETIVSLFDEERRFVTVLVPTTSAPLFQSEALVQIEFANGEVREGIVQAHPPQTVLDSDSEETHIELRILPSGKLWPVLAIGSSVSVEPAHD